MFTNLDRQLYELGVLVIQPLPLIFILDHRWNIVLHHRFGLILRVRILLAFHLFHRHQFIYILFWR